MSKDWCALIRALIYLGVGLALLAVPAVVRSQTATGPKPKETPQVPAVPTTVPETAPPPSTTWPPGLLMESLDKIGAKPALDNLSLRIYGVEEAGFTGKLHNKQETPLFGRVFDTYRADNIQPDQLRLIVERPYDNSKSFDVGGRFEMMYGSDAHITKNSFPGATEYAIPENVGEGVRGQLAGLPPGLRAVVVQDGQGKRPGSDGRQVGTRRSVTRSLPPKAIRCTRTAISSALPSPYAHGGETELYLEPAMVPRTSPSPTAGTCSRTTITPTATWRAGAGVPGPRSAIIRATKCF